MLYDNALLARAYLHAWQLTGDERWTAGLRGDARLGAARDARARGRLLLGARRRLRGRGGPLLRLDARTSCARSLGARIDDDAIERLLGYWGVTAGGQLRGPQHPARPPAPSAEPPPELARARDGALRARATRARLARPRRQAAHLLERADDRGARRRRRGARTRRLPRRRRARCAEFMLRAMRDDDGRLLRTYKDGAARLNAYLEDHAFLVEALLRLYEATFETRWFDAAREPADAMIERFADDETAASSPPPHDHEELIARRKDFDDHPIPSGNSSAALRPAAARGAHRRDASLRGASGRRPPAVRAGGGAAPRGLRPPAPGDRLPLLPRPRGRAGRARKRPAARRAWAELAEVVRSAHRPHVVLAGGPEGTERPELLRERSAVDGSPPPTSASTSPARRRSRPLTSWPRSSEVSRAGGAEFHPRHALLRVSMKFGDRTRPPIPTESAGTARSRTA